MNNFFAKPTDVWGDDAVKLTTAGIFTIIAVIAVLIIIALLVHRRQSKEKEATAKLTTKQLVFSSAAIALAVITSMIKLFELPWGGSVTLLSMLFIVLIANWYGPYVGIMTGTAYGLLQFVMEPIFYTIPQMLIDYPLAFGALGLAGIFWKKKNGLIIGYLVGVLGRYVFAILSGVIFFAEYAWDGWNPTLYSMAYNGSYLALEAAITIVVIALPPVAKALKQIKQMTV